MNLIFIFFALDVKRFSRMTENHFLVGSIPTQSKNTAFCFFIDNKAIFYLVTNSFYKEDYILFIYNIEDCNNMFDIIKLLNEFGWNNQSSIDIINKVILTK